MLTQLALPIICVLVFGGNRENEAIKARLIGTWNLIGTEEDGKVSKIDNPAYKVVITGSTMSVFVEDDVIWGAVYRIDASKTPLRTYYEVTCAPCLSGSRGEIEDTVSFDGRKVKIASMILEKR